MRRGRTCCDRRADDLQTTQVTAAETNHRAAAYDRRMAADLATIERGMAAVNGTQLYYEASGFGPTLLFMHGFTLDHRMWSRQVLGLSNRYRTVIYDLRGFGRSAQPNGAPFRHAQDAAALCDHLGIEHVVAIGHSIGAYQALELALSRPDLVAGWVAVCMSAPELVPFSDDLKRMFSAIRKAAREQSLDAAKEIWRKAEWFAPLREDAELASELDRVLADYSGWDWTHESAASGLKPSIAERLGELEVPALVITGGRDLEHNDRVAQVIMKRVPSASGLRIARAGHMANMEDPAAVNRAIAEFAMRTGAP
jgi:3-oxoadipate enol-lactonase